MFDPPFEDRTAHLQAALALLPAFTHERCIVFLDPDTGLAPQVPTLDHVLESEAHSIWKGMKAGDVFAFYQHQTNRAGRPWIDEKRTQLAKALNVSLKAVKIARAPKIANDVVFFYVHRA